MAKLPKPISGWYQDAGGSTGSPRPRAAPAAQRPEDPDLDAWLARLDASIALATKGGGTRRTGTSGATRAPISPIAPREVAGPHPASLDGDVLLGQCALTKARTSGPGGQHRNKVETAALLRHEPTGVRAQASERRDFRDNLRVALARLRLSLAVFVRCPVPMGEARSELWKRRVPEGGRTPGAGRVSPRHADFPAMLAEALDVIWACDLDHKRAAARLACTPSQLVKLLRDHAPALVWLNGHRLSRGEHTLK